MRMPQDRILHIDTEIKNGKVNVVAEWQGELVRCKDCLYYSPMDENKPFPCGHGLYMCNKDDYCSYGERKGGDLE